MAAGRSDNRPHDDIIIDIDALEDDRGDEKPFVAKVHDRVMTFLNPKDLDWLDLAALGDDPIEFVELCVEDEKDKALLMSKPLPSWKAEKLVEGFMRHYGLRRGNRAASRR